MSKTRLVITAVVIHNQPVAHVAATYGVSRSWLYELLARYADEGEAAFEPHSRRPKTVPTAIPTQTVELILEYREKLTATGLDAGPETIKWHLKHHHGIDVGRTTIARYLQAHGLVAPEPKKKPKSSYIRFAAALPNQTWQADFTHYRLTKTDGRPSADCEILTWLDDCSRYALSVTTHHRVTGTIVLATFCETVTKHGIPASTLTDNGMVFTTRLSQGKKGANTRNGFETELRRLGIIQKNSTPGHPTTCGKVERFQQTLKKWLRAQPNQPATIDDLQALLDAFVTEYNDHRPHRSLPHRATPATVYTTTPKATPNTGARDDDTHDRLRHDIIDKTGKVTWRYHGQLYSIGIGRTHTRTRVLILSQDRDIRIINATTGELLRELTLDPAKRYQPIPPKNTQP